VSSITFTDERSHNLTPAICWRRVVIPTQLLVFAVSACLFLALAAKNHAALTEAVGPATYSLPSRIGSSNSKSRIMTSIYNCIICNPFTLTVLIFASTLTISSLLIPAQQLAPLDKVVALLESIAMFYIAYPAAVTTGKVLLQTAPPGVETLDGDMGRLKRVISEVRYDYDGVINQCARLIRHFC
jgi:hypothetical protein